MSDVLAKESRQQVLNRLMTFRTACGFVEPGRVQAALQLQREGVMICWREHVGSIEILVCKLAVKPLVTGGARA